MKRLGNWCCWTFWRYFPQYLPVAYQREILALSPFVCRQIGQGSPMIVMRREIFDAGEYEEVAEAPSNRAGEVWILKKWLQENPKWRPTSESTTARS